MNKKNLKELIKKKNLILLDVRTFDEVDKRPGIKNSINIPVDRIRLNLEKLDKNKNIIVFCCVGIRSAKVAHFLKSKGFNAQSLEGGLDEWESK